VNEFCRFYVRDLARTVAGVAGREIGLSWGEPSPRVDADATLDVSGVRFGALVGNLRLVLYSVTPPPFDDLPRRFDGPRMSVDGGTLYYAQPTAYGPDRQSVALYLEALGAPIFRPAVPDAVPAGWAPRKDGGWRYGLPPSPAATVVLAKPERVVVDGRERPALDGVRDRRTDRTFWARGGALLPVWRLTVFGPDRRPARMAYFDGPDEAMRAYPPR
jgi:hypothetical protein